MSTNEMIEHPPLPDWHEPFPLPQTMPRGWDFSGIMDDPAFASAPLADLPRQD
jgi:hypothetical protein